jgi:hypothetical protein
MTETAKRPVGRPAKYGSNSLDAGVHLRLSGDERQLLDCWAGILGITVSDVVREQLKGLFSSHNNSETPDSPTPTEPAATQAERIGVHNAATLARQVNRGCRLAKKELGPLVEREPSA